MFLCFVFVCVYVLACVCVCVCARVIVKVFSKCVFYLLGLAALSLLLASLTANATAGEGAACSKTATRSCPTSKHLQVCVRMRT